MQAARRGGRVGGREGGGVRRYCTGPSGSGRKHRRKRTKDILKYAPFDIDRNGGPRNATRYVFMLTVSGGHGPHPILLPLSCKRTPCWPLASFHLSNKLTVYLWLRTTGGERGRRDRPPQLLRESDDGSRRRRQVHQAGDFKGPMCQNW